MIKTAQIRLIADTRDEALAAIAALKDAIGHARVAINSPRLGRDKAGDGNPPWLAYGTFQFDDVAPVTIVASPATEQRATRSSRASTGKTTKPKQPATGRTKKLAATGKTKRLKKKTPESRNVVTPDDIGSRGVFLGYDAVSQRYYAQGIVGPLAGRISRPLRLKSDAAEVGRGWISMLERTGQVPPPWQPGDWRPAPQAPIVRKKHRGQTKKLARKRP